MLKLNKKQLEAILANKGNYAIIAGAGSGKTTIIIHRGKKLVEKYGVQGKDILIISFTTNAKDNLITRFKKEGIEDIAVHTFHSLCFKLMMEEGIDFKEVNLYTISNEFRKYDKTLKNGAIQDILSFIAYQKNYGKLYNDKFESFDIDIPEETIRTYYKIYEDAKNKLGMYDFGDMLLKGYEILLNNPNKYTYKYLMVDEHQDSNLIQNKIIKLLCPDNNIFCVFDYRQAIFKFSGANPEYCMNFDKDFDNATIINLDYNYRSCNNIVNKANSFIKKYYGSYKHYSDAIPNIKDNGKIQVYTSDTKDDESITIVNKIKELISKGEDINEIAVLYRLNSNSNFIENELRKENIPYDIKSNGTFFKRKEVELIISVLRLILDTSDNEAFEILYKLRAYNLHTFSRKDLNNLRDYAGKYNLSFFQSLGLMNFKQAWQKRNVNNFIDCIEKLRLQRERGVMLNQIINNISCLFNMEWYIKNNFPKTEQEDRMLSIDSLKKFIKGDNITNFINYTKNPPKSDKDGVKLMTIHKSKGLEFKNVFVVGIEDGKFPNEKSDLIEEARLFYVGITRPKENLYLSQIFEGNRFINEYLN